MNITRLINLFRAYFIENKKMLLILSFIIFGVTAFESTISVFAGNSAPLVSRMIIPYLIPFWIAGTFFQSYLKKNNSAHFFNLPVSTGEKFIHAVSVLFILMVIIQALSLAGVFTGDCFCKLFNNNNVHISSEWKMMTTSLQGYLPFGAMLSAFLFGSIYFKKNAFMKTSGCIIGFLIGMSLYLSVVIPFAIGVKEFHTGGPFYLHVSPSLQTGFSYIFPIILTVFFLSLTYLRLKETEV